MPRRPHQRRQACSRRLPCRRMTTTTAQSPYEMAQELAIDSGVWAVSICATEIEDGQKGGDHVKVQYWLKVTRALTDILIDVT